MSYRLVAKRRPPTLRVQTNNSSLQNRVSKIRFNSYNSNLIQVLRFSVIVSGLFVFETIILSVFKRHFLKKPTHLFTLNFYRHIQHVNVLDEKTLFRRFKRVTGVKTWSSMNKCLVLSKHAPLFTEKRCRSP